MLIPGIIGPAIGAFVLRNAQKIVNDDGTESFQPNGNIYLAALIAAAVLLLALAAVIRLLKKEEAQAQ